MAVTRSGLRRRSNGVCVRVCVTSLRCCSRCERDFGLARAGSSLSLFNKSPGHGCGLGECGLSAACGPVCLTRRIGPALLFCASGKEQGIELNSDWRPEVAFNEIGLPGLDGFEFAQPIRARQRQPTPYLEALTGYDFPSDCEKALAAEFNVRLVKPLKRAELHSLLDRIGHVT